MARLAPLLGSYEEVFAIETTNIKNEIGRACPSQTLALFSLDAREFKK